MKAAVYPLNIHGTSYTLTKPAPVGEGGSVYASGGRLDKDLRRGRPYESRLLDLIRTRNLTGVAVDVGAHIGNHAVYLAAVCGLQVHAFEPDPVGFVWLERNIETNGLGERVHAHPVALGSTQGVGRWDDDTKGLVNPGSGDIPIRTLDSYQLADVSLIKIDVEGNEPDVLRGARDTLMRCRPVVYAEAASARMRVRVSEVLEPLGFQLAGVVNVSTPLGCWEPQ